MVLKPDTHMNLKVNTVNGSITLIETTNKTLIGEVSDIHDALVKAHGYFTTLYSKLAENHDTNEFVQLEMLHENLPKFVSTISTLKIANESAKNELAGHKKTFAGYLNDLTADKFINNDDLNESVEDFVNIHNRDDYQKALHLNEQFAKLVDEVAGLSKDLNKAFSMDSSLNFKNELQEFVTIINNISLKKYIEAYTVYDSYYVLVETLVGK